MCLIREVDRGLCRSASQIHMDNLTTNLLKWAAPECLGLQFQCLLIAESKGYDK